MKTQKVTMQTRTHRRFVEAMKETGWSRFDTALGAMLDEMTRSHGVSFKRLLVQAQMHKLRRVKR
jgi:hypothetical protein